jgi:hypothetical protein
MLENVTGKNEDRDSFGTRGQRVDEEIRTYVVLEEVGKQRTGEDDGEKIYQPYIEFLCSKFMFACLLSLLNIRCHYAGLSYYALSMLRATRQCRKIKRRPPSISKATAFG